MILAVPSMLLAIWILIKPAIQVFTDSWNKPYRFIIKILNWILIISYEVLNTYIHFAQLYRQVCGAIHLLILPILLCSGSQPRPPSSNTMTTLERVGCDNVALYLSPSHIFLGCRALFLKPVFPYFFKKSNETALCYVWMQVLARLHKHWKLLPAPVLLLYVNFLKFRVMGMHYNAIRYKHAIKYKKNYGRKCRNGEGICNLHVWNLRYQSTCL